MGTWGNFGATDREMKLCSGLLFSAAVTAQYADDAGTDRWGNYDYVGGFTYPTEGKDDGGNSEKNDFSGMNHYNGLYCWIVTSAWIWVLRPRLLPSTPMPVALTTVCE